MANVTNSIAMANLTNTLAMANTFLYFAYGSNLLAQRIHINNPTAVRRGIGKIKDFRLDFGGYSTRWHGAAATIVPTVQNYVWGAIWEIHNSNMADLDEQEGVGENMYFPLTVDVETPSGQFLSCRVYQQCNNPTVDLRGKLLPLERRPSAVYWNTILRGAKESGLPPEYIRFIETIPDNGYNGETDIGMVLNCIVLFLMSLSLYSWW